MKEKELLEKEAREEFFTAIEKFKEDKKHYLDAKHKYYETIEKISAMFPFDNCISKEYTDELIKVNNIKDIEIKNYNSKKVYDYIISNADRYFNVPDFVKNKIQTLKIDNINKLAAFSAITSNDYILKYIIENKKKDYINNLVKLITKDTFGVIVYDEQVEAIISLFVSTNEQEGKTFYESLKELRSCKINVQNIQTTIIDYIKQKYCKKYIEQFKTPYYCFVTSATEKGIKENQAKKLFNLLVGYFLNRSYRFRFERIHYAELLYITAFIELNYPNRPISEVKNESQK